MAVIDVLSPLSDHQHRTSMTATKQAAARGWGSDGQ
jgi:hypothetical protein